MKKLSIVVLGAMLLPMSSVYAETQPTVEGAHAFIKEMVERGSLTGYHIWRYDNEITDFKSQNCETSYTVTRSTSIGGGEGSRVVFVTIPWNKVSEITKGSLTATQDRIGLQYGIWVMGSFLIKGNTYLEDSNRRIFKVTDSEVTQQRIIKAMDFLRQQCDTSSKYGF